MLSVATAATLLAACGDKPATTTTEAEAVAPAVSPAEAPGNTAVDATPMTDAAAPTPGANSFTEAQARSAIEGAGYTGVGALTQNADGIWQAKATKSGAETTVSVDYKGVVTAQ
ncbi:hypothetical protein [Phenylobacterium sp.]|uniref:hypothetical protein n=1 Tax=Phenylobacterium sp. TaxID=1871053 RepID=UPI00286D1814|nr:hypothetical protein [Phenylobacterium sp.]